MLPLNQSTTEGTKISQRSAVMRQEALIQRGTGCVGCWHGLNGCKRLLKSIAAVCLFAVGSLVSGVVTPGVIVAEEGKGKAEGANSEDQRGIKSPVVLRSNVEFANIEGESLLCDVYSPRPEVDVDDQPKKRPAVVVVHGGAWASGDKFAIGTFAKALAERGFVAISVNYRLAPEHKFPSQVDDVRSALVWLQENSKELAVDPDRVGLLGYSAGAHLSCLLGTLVDAPWETIAQTTAWSAEDPRWKRMPKLRAIVGGGAPCEFRDYPPDSDVLTYFFGGTLADCPETYAAASPVCHASAGDVPTLLIHGTRDAIVPISSSQAMHEALKQAGVVTQLVVLDGPGHLLTFLHPQTKAAAVEFLIQQLH